MAHVGKEFALGAIGCLRGNFGLLQLIARFPFGCGNTIEGGT